MSEGCWLPEQKALDMPEMKALPSHVYTVAAWPPQEQKSGGSNGNGYTLYHRHKKVIPLLDSRGAMTSL